MQNPNYSIIMPVRNEAESLPQLMKEIEEAMRGLRYEIIAVDDASTDHPKFCTIHFPKHQGKWAALRAGIAKSQGDIIITMDSDLQDNPKDILRLVKKLKQGYDVVSGWRENRRDPAYKVAISRLGNILISFLTEKPFHDLNAPLKAYRRNALMALPHEGSLLRFSLLFAHKLGYRSAEVAVSHRRRLYGVSKFGLIKYIRILYDLILIELLFTGSNRLYIHKNEKAS